MVSQKTKIEKLEELFARKLEGLDAAALGDVCAGILDIPDAYRKIFDERLPKLKQLLPTDYGELLDELISLRFEFEHMKNHAQDAVSGLDKLILLLQGKE